MIIELSFVLTATSIDDTVCAVDCSEGASNAPSRF